MVSSLRKSRWETLLTFTTLGRCTLICTTLGTTHTLILGYYTGQQRDTEN